MNAFRKGFNAVFPIERLGSFAPEEVSFLWMLLNSNYCIERIKKNQIMQHNKLFLKYETKFIYLG
jgi:hypothetical protein